MKSYLTRGQARNGLVNYRRKGDLGGGEESTRGGGTLVGSRGPSARGEFFVRKGTESETEGGIESRIRGGGVFLERGQKGKKASQTSQGGLN